MDWKKVTEKIFFPPIWFVILCTFLTILGLIAVFTKQWNYLFSEISVYVFSFYSLVILCGACIKTFPRYYKKMKRKVCANSFANRYFSDKVFKTNVNLYRSLLINLLYVGSNFVSAILYDINWFGIFAIYYAIMAIMRFLLVRYTRKNQIGANRLGELTRLCFCSALLLTVNLILSAVVLMMVYQNQGFEYQGYFIYVMALYTFYITITAIIDMVKYRKYKSPVMTMSVVIKLTAALFSMLFLETAMFSQFGADTAPQTKRTLIMATGALISGIVVTISVYMIIRASKEIREIKGVKEIRRIRK